MECLKGEELKVHTYGIKNAAVENLTYKGMMTMMSLWNWEKPETESKKPRNPSKKRREGR